MHTRILQTTIATLLATASIASAQNVYWDPGLTPTANGGTGSGGTGSWSNNTTTNWSNGTSNIALNANTQTANFAGASGGTVTLGNITTNPTVNGLRFLTSGYTLQAAGTNTVLAINVQTGGNGVYVDPAVTGTVINLPTLHLNSPGTGTRIGFTNTDLVDFGNTSIYFNNSSRTLDVTNSSSSGTTTLGKFSFQNRTAPGSWSSATLNLVTGNIQINNLAAVSSSAGVQTFYPGHTTVVAENNATFSASANTTGTITINGDNGLFHANNSGSANGTTTTILNVVVALGNSTLALGHDNALGATRASGVASGTALELRSGTLAAAGGSRTLANNIRMGSNSNSGSVTLGGSNALTLNGTFTLGNGGGSTVTVTNTAATAINGNVFLSDNSSVGRTLTIGGAGNLTIGGSIANFNGSGVAGGLTKNGTGTLTLANAANNFTGNTTINAGTVALGINNGLSASSAINLGNATLDLASFSSSAASLALTNNNAKFKVNLAGRPLNNTTAFLNLSGGLAETATSGYTFDFGGFNASVAGYYKLLGFTSVAGTIVASDFAYSNLTLTDVTAVFQLNSSDLSIVFTTVIPEPSSFALLGGLACAGFAASRRRRR